MPRWRVSVRRGSRGDGGGKGGSSNWIRAIRVALALAATAALTGQSVCALPLIECSVDIECSRKDNFAVCDESHSLCVCTQGRYREPPYKEIKCSVGKGYNEKCRSPRECLLVDQYLDCIGGVCRCVLGYHPISIGNNSQGSLRCVMDPFYFNVDHANLTFFKVSPVPLLVICIILVYLGYQRGAKVPQRRGSSTSSNRRIVPMWRGVTFHQTTPVSNGAGQGAANGQTAITPPRNSASGSLGGGASGVSQTIVVDGVSGCGGQRRESSAGTASTAGNVTERESGRGRGSAPLRRDSAARERQERVTTHPHNITHNHSMAHSAGSQQHLHGHQQLNSIADRRSSAMSPPPPYAEEAPPSYEDAIRASRVAMGLDDTAERGANSDSLPEENHQNVSGLSAASTGAMAADPLNNFSSGQQIRNNQSSIICQIQTVVEAK